MNLSTQAKNRVAMPVCVDGSLDGLLSVHRFGNGWREKARFQERFLSLPFASVSDWTGQISIGVWGSVLSSRTANATNDHLDPSEPVH